MKFNEYIKELEIRLANNELGQPFEDITSREKSEVDLLLGFICTFSKKYHQELAEFEPLASLFRKEYLDNKQHFFTPESVLELVSHGEKLFDYRDDSYFIIDGKVHEESLKEIYDNWLKWIEEKKKNHQESQKEIKENMSFEMTQSKLLCRCQLCMGDFRAKLRELARNELISHVDKKLDGLEDIIIDQSIDKTALIYSGIKKNLSSTLYKLRRKLKPGTIRRLEKEVKNYLEEKMGAKSSLAYLYWEKLRIKLNSMLLAKDLKPDMASEEEVIRFFTQMGLGIWKFEKALEKEMSKFITAVMTFKRKDISSNILKDYLGQFWVHSKARKMKRKIIYHMGPTNSGKTYHAIQALSQAKTGCYLAPLRLLAGELYDTLNDKDVPTSLLTGEEVIDTQGATHYASTIEMAKLNETFDCCVIDEIQMITDAQRGWAWTRALIGICAPEIHICGDPSVLNLVREILKLTQDELEVIEYQRMTKLHVEKRAIRLTDLKKNDALIVFSRKNALKYKGDLEDLGFRVSIVYGRLSPEVRREQARKFSEGETDIIVSTDAIAMGMNLPVERIVFSTVSKFYNSTEHFLSNSEIKQIAGRAGRYQLFPTGYVTCLMKVEDGLNRLQEALDSELEQAELAMVGPDLDIFSMVNTALHNHSLSILSLTEFLMLFNTIVFQKPFECVDLKEMIEVAEMVEEANQGLNSMSDAEIFGFACAPVNLGQVEHVQYFNWIVGNYAHKVPIPHEKIDQSSKSIDYLEMGIKCIELFQWLSRHFEGQYFQYDEKELLENKSQAVEKLNVLLSDKIVKSCSSCGADLPDKFSYNICEECFSTRRFNPRRRGRKPNTENKGRGENRRSRSKKTFGKNTKKNTRNNKAKKFTRNTNRKISK